MEDGPPTPPQIDHISMLFNYTHKVSHIEKCTYTHGTYTMADGWQMADLCYTITPNKCHI